MFKEGLSGVFEVICSTGKGRGGGGLGGKGKWG